MTAAIIGSVLLGLVMSLYILLICGLPLGEFAMGGKSKTLSSRGRVTAAISVFIQAYAILILLSGGDVVHAGLPSGGVTGALWFFTIFFILNTGMNALSKSRRERLAMTPAALATAICFLLTALAQ